MATTISELKKTKRVAEANVTKALTELSTAISEVQVDKMKLKNGLERVEQLRQEVLSILQKLEAACEEKEELQQAKQFGDEYEEFNEKIDREMSNIRTYLNKSALKNVEEIVEERRW